MGELGTGGDADGNDGGKGWGLEGAQVSTNRFGDAADKVISEQRNVHWDESYGKLGCARNCLQPWKANAYGRDANVPITRGLCQTTPLYTFDREDFDEDWDGRDDHALGSYIDGRGEVSWGTWGDGEGRKGAEGGDDHNQGYQGGLGMGGDEGDDNIFIPASALEKVEVEDDEEDAKETSKVVTSAMTVKVTECIDNHIMMTLESCAQQRWGGAESDDCDDYDQGSTGGENIEHHVLQLRGGGSGGADSGECALADVDLRTARSWRSAGGGRGKYADADGDIPVARLWRPEGTIG